MKTIRLSDTGERVPEANAVQYVYKNKKYFTSEDAYKIWKKNNESRSYCIDELISAMGYKKGQKIPSYLFRKMQEYEPNSIGYPVLLETIKACRESIEWAVSNKEFDGEMAKIAYVFAIISNNYMDVGKRIKQEKSNAEKSVEQKNIPDEDIDIKGCTEKKKDFTDFL